MDMILGKCKCQKKFSSLCSVTFVVGTHWDCPYEAIPTCTYNICLFNKLGIPPKIFLNKFSNHFVLIKEMSM